MPPAAAELRAHESATLERLTHERFVSDEIGRLLDELEPYADGLDPDSDDACLFRVTRRDWEKARKVPAELRGEMAQAAAAALPVWVEARRSSDFRSFLPYLERNLELKLRYVHCFDGAQSAYDILLDDFEPEMKTAEVAAVFDELKRELPPLIEQAAAGSVDDSFLRGPFPLEPQRQLNRSLLEALGWNEDAWRLDEIVHPAAYGLGTTDIRITTRYAEDGLESLFSSMHEFGRPSAPASRSACTSRSRACGRTSSGAACRSCAGSTHASSRCSQSSSARSRSRTSTAQSTRCSRR
jgi:carboxypeptidase Taq